MVRDRVPPNVVGMTCQICGLDDRVSETQANHLDENDIPHVCSNCYEHIEDLGWDIFGRSQVKRMETLADYLKLRGHAARAARVRNLANLMSDLEPIIRGTEEWKSGDFADLSDAIEKWE